MLPQKYSNISERPKYRPRPELTYLLKLTILSLEVGHVASKFHNRWGLAPW